MMTIDEYFLIAKSELDKMYKLFISENKKDPEGWPLTMTKEEWMEQELASRFGEL